MITRKGLSLIGLVLFLAALFINLLIFTVAVAQEMPDVIGVRMTDGSVIEGSVIKATAEFVTIRTKDGQVVTKKFSEIENFIRTGESLKPSLRTRYEESPLYVGVFGGYVLTDKADADFQGGSYKIDVDDSWLIGVKLGANIPTAPFANFEIEFNYIFSHDIPEQTRYSGANYIRVGPDSNVYLSNLLLNFVLRYPYGNFRPYLGAGIGWSRFEIGGNYSALINGTTYTAHDASDDAFSFQFLAGVNYRFDRLVSLDAGYRYFVTEPEVAGVDVSYRAHLFTLGLNYHFW